MQVYFPDTSGGGAPNYQKLIPIKNGESFTKEESSYHPQFIINIPPSTVSDGPIVMVMYDVTVGYLHLLAYGILNGGEMVTELIPYKGPQPPPGSGVHKYYFILYDTIDPKFSSRILTSGPLMTSLERAHFDLEKFVEDNSLNPISSLYFSVSA